MSSLAQRVVSASVCGGNQSSTTQPALPYPDRMDKVKFGAPLESVCGKHDDIPGPLLVMILKLNKEAPFKKDVFRAPGHKASIDKLIHLMQIGRMVNVDNYSVYTIASVLKKFVRKLPTGVFGPEREHRLFQVIDWEDGHRKRQEIHGIFASLPLVTKHFLVLLLGTFRAIAEASERARTGMTSEAIGVSVGPSFFKSCVSAGQKLARMEDLHRFKVATNIMKFLIDNFGISCLFDRDCYEYYARMSGRVFQVNDNLTFTFRNPIEVPEECPERTPALAHRNHHQVDENQRVKTQDMVSTTRVEGEPSASPRQVLQRKSPKENRLVRPLPPRRIRRTARLGANLRQTNHSVYISVGFDVHSI